MAHDFRSMCEALADDVRYLLECIDDGGRGDAASLEDCADNLDRALAMLFWTEPTRSPVTDPTTRELISRLADELDRYRQLLTDSRHESHALAVEARAYLAAEPPAVGTWPQEGLAARPLLEQVARMGDCIGANTVAEISTISSRAAAWLEANPPGQPVAIEPRGCPTPGACSCVEPAPPAEGEKLDLAVLLSVGADCDGGARLTSAQCRRAAALLQQQYPRPVPVSERLPGAEDCDGRRWCWVLYPGFSTWNMEPPLGQDGQPWNTGWSHWLPAHALPLPTSGEVK